MRVAQVELDAERDAPGDQPPRDGQRQAQDARAGDRERERRSGRDWSPSRIWSIARPVSHGIATVIAIATAASRPDQMTPRAVGAQEPQQSSERRHGVAW